MFKYETNHLIENFTYPYMPEVQEDNGLDDQVEQSEVKAINPHSMHIIDYSAIPSSAILL